jgi:hypothetical protein
MDFYFAGRDHRFGKKQPQGNNSQQQPVRQTNSAAYRFVKVVDALTYHKKSIFSNIIYNYCSCDPIWTFVGFLKRSQCGDDCELNVDGQLCQWPTSYSGQNLEFSI